MRVEKVARVQSVLERGTFWVTLAERTLDRFCQLCQRKREGGGQTGLREF